jgi:hypothetical protein
MAKVTTLKLKLSRDILQMLGLLLTKSLSRTNGDARGAPYLWTSLEGAQARPSRVRIFLHKSDPYGLVT